MSGKLHFKTGIKRRWGIHHEGFYFSVVSSKTTLKDTTCKEVNSLGAVSYRKLLPNKHFNTQQSLSSQKNIKINVNVYKLKT